MKKVLSVSIAAYNVQSYLRETLDNFLIPDLYDKLEVIIVDDGSTDNTSDIAKNYSQKYPMIFKYIKKENAGWGSTVNRGIKEAGGKYFKQLDGDDFFDKEGLIKLVELLEDIDSDAIFTKYTSFIDGTNNIYNEFEFNEKLHMEKEVKIEEIINYIENIAMHNLTIKTSILKENYSELKLTENCFYTDVEYLLKIMNKIKTVTICPISVYWYRLGRTGQSVSIDGICKHYNEHLKVLKNLLNYMDNKVTDENIKKFFIQRLTTMASVQYERYLCLPICKKNKSNIIKYDKWLSENYPILDVVKWKKIKILKLTNFIIYPLMCKYVRKQIESMYK